MKDDNLNPNNLVLTLDERQAEDELKEAQSTYPNPDPISDDEKDINLSTPQDIQPAVEIEPHPNNKPLQNITDIRNSRRIENQRMNQISHHLILNNKHLKEFANALDEEMRNTISL